MESKRRRTENEKVLQERNKAVESKIEDLVGSKDTVDMVLNFYCECSDLDCGNRLGLPVREYQELTEPQDRFVICPDHENTDIERVVIRRPDLLVVEKLPD